jgi:hypothetical protein
MSAFVAKDGNGVNQNMSQIVAGDGNNSISQSLLVGGSPLSTSNPIPVTIEAGIANIGNVVLEAGSAKVGIVTTDQTNHGTTDYTATDITHVGGGAIALSNSGLPVDAAGTKVTAASIPTGGVGFLGWLSAIANYLAGILGVNIAQVNGSAISSTNGVPIYPAYSPPVSQNWTSATALNTSIMNSTILSNTVAVTIVPSGTITGGAITFEVWDAVTWVPIKIARTEQYQCDSTYALAGGQRQYQANVAAFTEFRVRLSTVIVGSGTVTVTTIPSAASSPSSVTAGLDPNQPLPAGTNSIGTIQLGNTPNTTPILANESDPAKTTGTITAADAASSSATNSLSQVIVTGTPTANSSVAATLSAHTGVMLQIGGTTNGTFVFERSLDGGTTWIAFSMEEVSIGASVSSVTISDNNTYIFRGNCGGLTNVRVRCTLHTSGTLNITWQPGFGVGTVISNQGTPNGIANAWAVNLVAATAGGSLLSSWVTDGTTISQCPLASAANVYKFIVANVGSGPLFFRAYNLARAAVPGTDTPIFRCVIPPGSNNIDFTALGARFSVGVAYVLTYGSFADNDTVAVPANMGAVNPLLN